VKVMKQYLAVDIGGSKTKAVVFDSKSTIAEYETIGFGTAVDSNDDIPELRELLSSISDKYDICSAAVNLGGKNKTQIQNIVTKFFPNNTIFRESEGHASAAFGRSCGANAVLLAGTGTIGIAFDENNYIISGGWGMNIGDGGSGYSIGLEAIKQSLAALDNTSPLTAMQKEITGIDEPIPVSADPALICKIRDNVRSRIFPIERKRVASYAKTVAKYCEKGEEDALNIMKTAGHEMAYMMSGCIMKIQPFKVRKVAVSGGLVNVRKYWQDEFENILQETAGVSEFIYENDGILLGTMRIASEQLLRK